MGLSASKRAKQSLPTSQFDIACAMSYDYCLNLTQHAFPGIRPYQLFDASTRLHTLLSTVHPLIVKGVPSPPNQTQVDHALKTVTHCDETLCLEEFKAFAVELYGLIHNTMKKL
ncbi:hypothetical protein GIB67_042971 [Kingdonia uniflora]|uniref:Uncharacterized protein n=1 Tax=Kingdonia uniflora TaxID=39325 RepID=A0A7J7L607_9MAGN|nr:hypothetical protein GIB67_042971 [Kingdonia uniflora]